MKKLLLCFALLISAVPAFAKDWGHFFCQNCKLGTPGQSSEIGYDQVLEAIGHLPFNPTPQIADTVTVCNGVSCVTSQLQGGYNGWHWLGATAVADPGKYVNQGGSLSVVRNGSATGNYTYTVNVWGHYEWWDYYSDGHYVASGDQVFIVDRMEVVYQPVGCQDSSCGKDGNVMS